MDQDYLISEGEIEASEVTRTPSRPNPTKVVISYAKQSATTGTIDLSVINPLLDEHVFTENKTYDVTATVNQYIIDLSDIESIKLVPTGLDNPVAYRIKWIYG